MEKGEINVASYIKTDSKISNRQTDSESSISKDDSPLIQDTVKISSISSCPVTDLNSSDYESLSGHMDSSPQSDSEDICTNSDCVLEGKEKCCENVDLNGPAEEVIKILTGYRTPQCMSESSDDESETIDTFMVDDSSSDDDDKPIIIKPSNKNSSDVNAYAQKSPLQVYPVKTKGEISLDDLPPVEEINISDEVSSFDLEYVGKILSIVGPQVIVQSVRNSPTLFEGTVFFFSAEEIFGRVDELFGPVAETRYIVRFNSKDEICEKSIEINREVFYAPKRKDLTLYLTPENLCSQKGSDASQEDNNEVPESEQEFSDDEAERAAKAARRLKQRNTLYVKGERMTGPHRKFERLENSSGGRADSKESEDVWDDDIYIDTLFNGKNSADPKQRSPSRNKPGVFALRPPDRGVNTRFSRSDYNNGHTAASRNSFFPSQNETHSPNYPYRNQQVPPLFNRNLPRPNFSRNWSGDRNKEAPLLMRPPTPVASPMGVSTPQFPSSNAWGRVPTHSTGRKTPVLTYNATQSQMAPRAPTPPVYQSQWRHEQQRPHFSLSPAPHFGSGGQPQNPVLNQPTNAPPQWAPSPVPSPSMVPSAPTGVHHLRSPSLPPCPSEQKTHFPIYSGSYAVRPSTSMTYVVQSPPPVPVMSSVSGSTLMGAPLFSTVNPHLPPPIQLSNPPPGYVSLQGSVPMRLEPVSLMGQALTPAVQMPNPQLSHAPVIGSQSQPANLLSISSPPAYNQPVMPHLIQSVAAPIVIPPPLVGHTLVNVPFVPRIGCLSPMDIPSGRMNGPQFPQAYRHPSHYTLQQQPPQLMNNAAPQANIQAHPVYIPSFR